MGTSDNNIRVGHDNLNYFADKRGMTKRWKFLNKGFKSAKGDTKWKIGEWATPMKNIKLCTSGYHCSKRIYQAFSYVQGPILAKVECRGKHEVGDDKEVWQTMRIVKAYKWTKKDSVALAIFSAELCIQNFEKVYPDDDRPRKAIEAAKRFLKYPSAKNRSAAWSAAESAESAAWSAAESAARSAAESARSAAESAAWSAAWSAARSAARSAAWSAAWSAAESAESATVQQISDWMDKRLLVLKEIK